MNKRAKKRLKEAIARDKQEKTKSLPQARAGASKDPQQRRFSAEAGEKAGLSSGRWAVAVVSSQ